MTVADNFGARIVKQEIEMPGSNILELRPYDGELPDQRKNQQWNKNQFEDMKPRRRNLTDGCRG
jgi:hypothetical protein